MVRPPVLSYSKFIGTEGIHIDPVILKDETLNIMIAGRDTVSFVVSINEQYGDVC